MALPINSNEQKIWDYLKSKGLSNYGCAGIMGNLYAESGLMPNNLQNTYKRKLGYSDDGYVFAVNNGTYTKNQFIYDEAGFGIAQWTHWSRKKAFYEFVKSQNKSISDLEIQLDYLYKELTEDYPSVLAVLKSATSILQASNAVLLKFERPTDQSVAVQNKRASYGQEYYNRYANSVGQNNTTANSATNSITANEQSLREKIVSVATYYVGRKESDGSHREIIDIYNSIKPLPVSYQLTYTDAWCAGFVTAVGIKAGLSNIVYRECSCPRMIELYKKNNRWVENDAYIPTKGDIIFYDWDDSGLGDNTGTSDHVGIVESVSGSAIRVIEGNMSNAVGYRTIQVNSKFIRGYGVPNYANKVGSAGNVNINTTNTPPSTSPSFSVSTNISGRIDTVREVQIWANTNYKSGLVVDGIYGTQTKKALVKILQTELNQTYGSKLVVDGIWGTRTRSACRTLVDGSKNDVVGALQALLICNGCTDVYLDKDYGTVTTLAVRTYQNKNGLTVDGKAGKNTFAKLCS